ncbi:transketolase family protein [Thermodesulfobium narugense]|uniref:transketolase family protein n=1 Tax=Thermodesulfobium narugense TaxID=184064 RepID=UPI00068C3BC7
MFCVAIVYDREIATREAYGKALVELGRQNNNVVVLDADLAKSTQTIKFAKEFPDRFFDVGIAEANMIGIGAGLAACGMIAFCSSFAIFATQRVLNQIFQSVAYPNLNVKIAASHAGISVGEDGATHQSIDDISIMRSIPNMTIIVPADAHEAYEATFAAANFEGPVYLRLSRMATPVVTPPGKPFEIGRAIVLREGKDITIAACGIMVYEALGAAERLSGLGVEAEVINFNTIKPFDRETLVESLIKTRAVLSVEEHSIIGGLGSAVAECVAEEFPVAMARVGIRDQFGQSGKSLDLLKHYQLTSEDIAKEALKLLETKRKANEIYEISASTKGNFESLSPGAEGGMLDESSN